MRVLKTRVSMDEDKRKGILMTLDEGFWSFPEKSTPRFFRGAFIDRIWILLFLTVYYFLLSSSPESGRIIGS